jgi:hypothetical protein
VTDANLMDADCIHGVPWYECEECPQQERPGISETRKGAARKIGLWMGLGLLMWAGIFLLLCKLLGGCR